MLRRLLLAAVLGLMTVATPTHEKSTFWCTEAKTRPWIVEQLLVARAKEREDAPRWMRACLAKRGHSMQVSLRGLCISNETKGCWREEAALVEDVLKVNEKKCRQFRRTWR